MPSLNPEARASQCSYTFSDGRRCRMPRVPAGEGCCATHARKLREERQHQEVIDYILQPVAHTGIASTNLTFLLIRVLNAVIRGQLSPKLSNALLRIIEAMRKTIPDTSNEFARTFDARQLRETIRALYTEHEDYIGVIEHSPAASSNPLPPLRQGVANQQPPPAPTQPATEKTGTSTNPSPSESPEIFDFLLEGRPLSSRVTPKDVDNFGRILEQRFAASRTNSASPK